MPVGVPIDQAIGARKWIAPMARVRVRTPVLGVVRHVVTAMLDHESSLAPVAARSDCHSRARTICHKPIDSELYP